MSLGTRYDARMPAAAADSPPVFTVLGLQIHALSPSEVVAVVQRWMSTGRREYICLANVHAVMERLYDPSLVAVYGNAALCLPDGVPLVWLGRRAGTPARRVYGPDLMLLLCDRAAALGWGVFFYGGEAAVPELLARTLKAQFPRLRVVGTESPPFRPLTQAEDDDVVRRINASGADVVFVGLGCPRQERWTAEHRSRLHASLLLGVGAAFDFHAGRIPQAPRWMMSAGLEWLFRLSREPRRLWYRYLVYNPLFLWHVLLQELGLRQYPR